MDEDSSFNYQESIIEGFICPSCLKFFSRPGLLKDHFDREHFCNTDIDNQSGNHTIPTPLGKVRSRTADFDKMRQTQVDRTALETNLLLIRLEKLANIPDNLNLTQRHALEESIVPWIDVKINLCPRCGLPFGLSWLKDPIPEEPLAPVTTRLLSPRSFSYRTRERFRSASRFAAALIDNDPVYRRMHHCRLCGHIICARCSFFLSKEEVIRVVEASPKLRICEVCKSVLEVKIQQVREKNSPSQSFEEFQALKKEMEKVAEKMPIYTSMAISLSAGEEKYVLDIAKSLRLELLQSLQNIDMLGRSIASLDVSAAKSAATRTRLNRTIGQFARRFVQNNLPPLRILPSESEHRHLTQKRTTSLEPKRQEVEMLLEAGWMPFSIHDNNQNAVRSPPGEIALAETASFDENDPRTVLMRQIDLVADYLRQAQAARRSTGEINDLAQNLAELEIELMRLSAAPPRQ